PALARCGTERSRAIGDRHRHPSQRPPRAWSLSQGTRRGHGRVSRCEADGSRSPRPRLDRRRQARRLLGAPSAPMGSRGRHCHLARGGRLRERRRRQGRDARQGQHRRRQRDHPAEIAQASQGRRPRVRLSGAPERAPVRGANRQKGGALSGNSALRLPFCLSNYSVKLTGGKAADSQRQPEMAAPVYKVKLTRPQVFLWRMSLFLILAILLAIILDGQTQQLRHSFMANPGLNTLIIGTLIVGVVYSFRQVLRLYPEINWVNNFRISDPASSNEKTTPVLLAPMATMLRDRTGHLSLAAGSMRSLLDSVASRLDEQRETTRYLVGLLVFLGLLGTFWGLLQTVSSVGATIGALDTNVGENVMLFDQLKEGLAGPLKGMGTAFSCSMFGLAGSLILGFLDLQAGHAQGRFYNELEDWLSGITELQPADAAAAGAMPPQLRYALMDMQRSLSDLSEKVELKMLNDNTGDAVKDLAQGVDKLIRQMRAEQK